METNLKAKYSGILVRPIITEKTTLLLENNVYSFEISPKAGKKEVSSAIKAFYNISPIKVNIVRIPAKKVLMRGKIGQKSSIRKAYVFFKKGDKIE